MEQWDVLVPDSRIYITLKAAREWSKEHRSPMGMVALALARQSGSMSQGDSEGYDSAVVRVTDPVIMTEVRRQLTEKGFGSFSKDWFAVQPENIFDRYRRAPFCDGTLIGRPGGEFRLQNYDHKQEHTAHN